MMGQQPNRRDCLHRLSQPHFIGQHGPMPRVKEGDSVQLKAERLEGKVKRLGRKQRFQRRLQQYPQSVFQPDQIARRPNARVTGSGERGAGSIRRDGGDFPLAAPRFLLHALCKLTTSRANCRRLEERSK